ncbi:MAG: glycoside hydrolase family 88 protein [Acidobacteria bacterium]|nr:glycoside hydrolase family 88 protein [Acidobacteriota bacterium]
MNHPYRNARRVPFAGITAGLVLGLAGAVQAHAQSSPAGTAELAAALDTVAAVGGEPRIVSGAGMTRDDVPLLTLENGVPFDTSRPERRLVLVGGLDGDPDAARIVLDAVRWFKTAAPEAERARWLVSALPLALPGGNTTGQPAAFPPVDGFFDHPEQPESRYVWRWVAYQAPDLVVEVRAGNELSLRAGSGPEAEGVPAGSLAAALAHPANHTGLGPVDTLLATAGARDGAAVMREVLARARDRQSALRNVLNRRMARDPLTVARLMARRYPGTPSISYIPALAWVHTLRVAEMDDDGSLRGKVLEEVRPWLSGDRPPFGNRISFAALAGTMIFSQLVGLPGEDGETAARLAAEGVALAAAETAPGMPERASGWSDDFFLGTIAAVRAGDPEGLAAAVRLVTTAAARLQQSNGLFHHDAAAPTAWGRGNGFGALGLAELLTALPADHPERAAVLDVHRRHLAGMRAQQAPDGMWRQIVDVPGSYRETSVTAMTLTAMARGIRLGWLDDSYRPVVDRTWRALLAHVAADGALVDVCFSTGAGPTRRHYLDRPAVNGADDRGGAMVLGAALEYYDLLRAD